MSQNSPTLLPSRETGASPSCLRSYPPVKQVPVPHVSQTIVTRCTLYKQYTTEDALETAADSYGGLTDEGTL